MMVSVANTSSSKLREYSIKVVVHVIEDVLFDHKFQPEDVLGLDHIDKGPRRPNPAERAIVIR